MAAEAGSGFADNESLEAIPDIKPDQEIEIDIDGNVLN